MPFKGTPNYWVLKGPLGERKPEKTMIPRGSLASGRRAEAWVLGRKILERWAAYLPNAVHSQRVHIYYHYGIRSQNHPHYGFWDVIP